jgi:F-type H+-transporting ATPase subunit b
MPTVVLAQSNFLIPNGTFLVELAAFVIILAVIWRYVVPPVQGAMRQRRELIHGLFDESREARERAEAAEADYHASLAEARAEAARIREHARAQGQRIVDQLRETAQQEADRITAEGGQQLAASREALGRELRADVGTLGVELAGRIVGESLADEARRTGTVEQFLAELDERSGESSATAGLRR